MKIYKWGIIGLGKIARKFASDLQMLPQAQLYAVASTDQGRADAFAVEFGATHAFGSYEAIVDCPDLDIIYIATPHTGHFEQTMNCLRRGIAVLCEKPMAVTAAEVQLMVALARERKVFLMEALWTFFIPGTVYALQQMKEGAIGTVHTVKADFGFKAAFDPEWRLYNKQLAGGSLLDIGIYPALLALRVLGKPDPDQIIALATFTETDVDASCVFSFKYPPNGLAIGHSTISADTPIEAWLSGTEGSIYLHPRFHHTKEVTITRYDTPESHTTQHPYEGFGYHFEAAHVMACLDAGRTESDVVPLDFSLDLIETLDAIRLKIGLAYGG